MDAPDAMTPAREADVILPPHTRATRVRWFRTEPDGSHTFVLPRNGGLRTVPAECVKRWHTDQRIASAKQRKASE